MDGNNRSRDGVNPESPTGEREGGKGLSVMHMEPPMAHEPILGLESMMALIEPDFVHRIHTGVDVVQYYASYGHLARIKVFHCTKLRSSGLVSPYELLVVTKDVLSSRDYHTMSASGVVQVWADGSSPEFTPIGEWVREHSVYNRMRQLRFFRTYMLTRYLRAWRSAARSLAFERVRKKLASRLMCAQPEFCYTLMDLQHKVWDLRQTRLVAVGPKPLLLGEYEREQEGMRLGTAIPALNDVIANIARSLNRLISEVVKRGVVARRELGELGGGGRARGHAQAWAQPPEGHGRKAGEVEGAQGGTGGGWARTGAVTPARLPTWYTAHPGRCTMAGSHSLLTLHTHNTPVPVINPPCQAGYV
ncbi:MAG: hypothetical protein WDW38_005436 [Sanguina aurantia]